MRVECCNQSVAGPYPGEAQETGDKFISKLDVLYLHLSLLTNQTGIGGQVTGGDQ